MKTVLQVISALCIINATHATVIHEKALPCDPSAFGTHCIIHPSATPTKSKKYAVYCGSTHVYISQKQRDTLDAYLYEHKNMMLRFQLNGEFIDVPCK